MASIEQEIREQFSRYFAQEDWWLFKRMAEYYLKEAVSLRTRDVDIEKELKLLARNIQKRLFIGIGCELLLKSLYLKNGFAINLVKDKKRQMKNFPFPVGSVNENDFHKDNTHTFNDLLGNLHKVFSFSDISKIRKGLKIAKVFRNKEGHVVLARHKFDRRNYTDIEIALANLYKEGFSEDLRIKFSLETNEKPVWKISQGK